MSSHKSKEEVASALAEHRYLMEVGGFAMEHSLASVYSLSTVVCPPDVTIRGRWGNSEAGFLGEQLLLNYRPHSASLGFQTGIGRFFEHDAITSAGHAELEEDAARAVVLPRPKHIRAGLSAAVAARRSKRNFVRRPVSLADLSTLLQHAGGVSGHLRVQPSPMEQELPIAVRCAPSGGGLFPISLFVVALNVTDLDLDFYEYLPNSHALRATNTGLSADQVAQICYTPDFDILDGGFAVVYVYDLHKNSRKYGNSGVVFGFIEVGAISQNLHLARTAMGLAGCCQGGYNKQSLEKVIGLDGVSRHVVHVTVIGQEAN